MDMLSPTDALRLDCCLELLALLSLAPQSSVALQCADFSETLEQALGASGGHIRLLEPQRLQSAAPAIVPKRSGYS